MLNLLSTGAKRAMDIKVYSACLQSFSDGFARPTLESSAHQSDRQSFLTESGSVFWHPATSKNQNQNKRGFIY
jgi:hypothetical protein